MIARIWKGRVPLQLADQYFEYLQATGIPDYQTTEGNVAVQVLRTDDGVHAEFMLLTLWESWAAIQAFAGEPVDRARYYPKDEEYLVEMEPKVRHYEVLLSTAGAGPSSPGSRPQV